MVSWGGDQGRYVKGKSLEGKENKRKLAPPEESGTEEGSPYNVQMVKKELKVRTITCREPCKVDN